MRAGAETNRCIPQGYRLVLSVTLSYLIYNIKFCSTQSNYYIFGLNVFFERLLYFHISIQNDVPVARLVNTFCSNIYALVQCLLIL